MTRPTDADFDAWVERARAVPLLDAARECGAQLRKAGVEFQGPCPACGGTDRFAVNPKQGVYLCRGSGHNRGSDGGNSVIDLVMHAMSCDFVGACELLTHETAPKGRSGKPVDEEAQRQRRDEQKDQRILARTKEEIEFDESCAKAAKFFDQGDPIKGTHAEAYLRARGLNPRPDQVRDLRFVDELPYFGMPEAPHPSDPDFDEIMRNRRAVELGLFPAMLAAIRDVNMRLIGVHTTYLEPREPIKWRSRGDKRENKAKKVRFNARGGLIWLSEPRATLVVGEGIETTLAYETLRSEDADIPPDFAYAAAYSLGNMAGGALGSRPHPARKGQSIPDGRPDPTKPGMILPELVREVTFLVDRDSDGPGTWARIETAMARQIALGRVALAAEAPEGMDFNDELMARMQGEVAA